MKKKKIISAVSAIAFAVSSLVPLSANAYDIVYKEKTGVNNKNTLNLIKWEGNDNYSGVTGFIEELDINFLSNIKFTTKDGSILTEEDLPEILENGQEFHIEYENGVHTIVFEGDHCFLFGASERLRRCARGLTLRKNIENVERVYGKYIQYSRGWNGIEEWSDSQTKLEKEVFTYYLEVPYESTYVPVAEDFSELDVDSLTFSSNYNGYKRYNLNINADPEVMKKVEEDTSKIYLISNNYVDTYIKLKEIQEQSGEFVAYTSLFFIEGDYGGTPSRNEIGDFNLDDKIDVKDFFILSQFIAEVDKETINADRADVNRDGVADISDLLAIAQYIVK